MPNLPPWAEEATKEVAAFEGQTVSAVEQAMKEAQDAGDKLRADEEAHAAQLKADQELAAKHAAELVEQATAHAEEQAAKAAQANADAREAVAKAAQAAKAAPAVPSAAELGIPVQAPVHVVEHDEPTPASDAHNMTFGQALHCLKRAQRVQRPRLNLSPVRLEHLSSGHWAFISGGAIWMPTLEDMLAEDWRIVG